MWWPTGYRVDLEGPDPPLWRGLELTSDLFLDQVHDIIQVAFGWTDSLLVLEAVLPVAPGGGLAVCTGGFRRRAAEDCGAMDIHQLVEAATDSGNAQAAGAVAELAEIFGCDLDVGALVGTDYDPEKINGALEVAWGATVLT